MSTLTDWLRSWDGAALVGLLRARPDLAVPRPPDSVVLAARAASRASVARAADGLDTAALSALDSLLNAGADAAPVRVRDLHTAQPPAVFAAGLTALRSLALAWGDDDAVAVVPAAREVGNLSPATEHPAPAEVPGLLEQITAGEQQVLLTLAGGTGVGRTKEAAADVPLSEAATPVQRLLARGLLVRRDAETVVMPGQVAAALRGPAEEPALRTVEHSTATVDATAAGEVLELVRHVEGLLRLWSAEPAPVRKAGGVGVRDLRRTAKALEVGDERAVLLIELAAAAALIADSADLEPEWAPTTLADPWLAATPAQRWGVLAAGWLELPRLPGLVGRKDAKDKAVAPLADEARRPTAPLERLRALELLAALPEGTGAAEPDGAAAVLAWRAPRRGGRLRDDVVRWTLAEATALGVVALGALSDPGRTLLEGDTAAAARQMAAAMPEPVDHVLVQADLTVVAPGPLEPWLAARIGEVADLESAGAASVHRVTETSLRRALDAGRSAEDLHELFRTASRTPVPQSLTYLVDDVARRHGRLRGGAAACFLRCDDPALLAEVAAHPAAAPLRLRKIAPTVLVSPVPLLEVLEDLRAAGFAPAAEGSDGQVVDLRPTGKRVTAPARSSARRVVVPRPLDDDTLADMVAGLRQGDEAGARHGRTVTAGAGLGANSERTLAALTEAVREGRKVVVSLVDNHGTASRHVLTPVRVGAGLLEGTAGEQTHRVPLHRISAVTLVEET